MSCPKWGGLISLIELVLSSQVLNFSKDGDATAALDACYSAHTCPTETIVPSDPAEIFIVATCVGCLSPFRCAPLRRVWLCFLCNFPPSPIRYLKTVTGIPLSPPLLQAEQAQLLQSLLVHRGLQTPDYFSVPPVDSLRFSNGCLVTRSPYQDTLPQMQPQKH